MRKSLIICGVLFLNVAIAAVSLRYFRGNKMVVQEVQFVEKESYFSTFELDEDTGEVTIICYLVFCNKSDKEVQFQVFANFQKDQKNRLLRESLLQGRQPDTSSETFSISPNETLRCYVHFIGEYAGYPHKKDRNLPEKIFTRQGQDKGQD